MIYKFKSKASGDLVMLGPHGDRLLRLLGREPAAQGIIEPSAMPQAIAALEAAIAAAQRDGEPNGGAEAAAVPDEAPVLLRQRLWPVIEMLRRAQAADAPIVWGV
ncbi:MAG TPA: DUF1840 domain-containing protein [Rubrivivax sp.]|nr:DUF1840 domain-containing protein [Pseudomonadota bacterium]HOL36531.1 DUF1840 domain-containing protein [Rubrivivax sp.]HPP82206.1 DUF1840 domain-containing protein [Rubrivivax sp.]